MSTIMNMSVWKALDNRKKLKGKIADLQRRAIYCCVTTEAQTTIQGVPKEDYIVKMKANYQRIRQLYRNLQGYNTAINTFNASHEIEIAGVTYNVAGAIARQQMLPLEKEFLNSMKHQVSSAINKVETENAKIMDESKITEAIARVIQDKKFTTTDLNTAMQNIRDEYIRNNQRILLDPSDLFNNIDSLIDEVSDFEREYNEAFSRLNVTNYIDVELEDEI